MNSSEPQKTHIPRQLVYGVLAIMVSLTIATLINKGFVTPYPSVKVAYLICTVVGVSGVIQTIRGLFDLNKS